MTDFSVRVLKSAISNGSCEKKNPLYVSAIPGAYQLISVLAKTILDLRIT